MKSLKLNLDNEKEQTTALFVFAFLVFFTKLWQGPLGGDEACYALLSREILRTGDWLVLHHPFFSSWQNYYEHPPLYMWVTALNFKLFGVTDFAAKLFSAITGFASLVILYFTGKKMVDRDFGFIAAFILVTTQYFLDYSRKARLEIPLTFFMLLSFFFLVCCLKERKLIWAFLSGVAMSFAFLVKGVPAFASALLAGISFIVYKDALTNKIRNIGFFALGAIVILGPWAFAQFSFDNGRFFDWYIFKQVGWSLSGRSMAPAPKSLIGSGMLYYPKRLLLEIMVPWAFVALIGIGEIIKRRSFQNDFFKYLAMFGVIIVTFAFSLIQLKKARYVLPAVPFLAILSAEFFYNRSWRDKFILWASRLVILLTCLFLVVTVLTPIKLYSKKDGEFLPFRSIIENSTTRRDLILVAGMSPYTVQQVFSWYFDRPQEIVKNIKQFKVEWETGNYKFGILKSPSGADIVGELKPYSRSGSYFLFINEKMQNSSAFAVQQTNSFEGIKKDKTEEREEIMSIQLTSAAFEDGGMIPKKFTCDSENASPPLKWSGIPDGTQSISLICDDPDAPAGTWVHWVIYNMPGGVTGLPENIPSDRVLGNGAKQGMNDFRGLGYAGPCPPGGTHRYFFKIYALDIEIDLEPGATKTELFKAMKEHILGEGQLMGKYTR